MSFVDTDKYMLTPRPSLASSESSSGQASQTQYQVTSPSNRRRSQRRQHDTSCSRWSWYLRCGGSASREICRCRHFAIPILEEITACTWILELSAFDQVDPLYVVSARIIGIIKLTPRLVLQEHHFRSHAFLGESSGSFEKRMLIM
jgi:hypothetical protein